MEAADSDSQALVRRVGAAIAAQRKSAGFTQARVADAVGLEKETISRLENGVIAPSIHRLAQFAGLFGCTVSALFGEYRGGAGEDSGALAAMIGDLPQDDRRAIIRVVSEFTSIAREREALRFKLELERELPRPTKKLPPKRL